MPKAATSQQAVKLTDIPNIGPSIAADLKGLGVHAPTDVGRMDPWHTYDALRGPMGQRHDPCLCDCFIAAVRFMEGGPATPWWRYTAERKRHFADHAG